MPKYNIKGENYNVKFVKRMPPGYEDSVGFCDRENKKITILKGMKLADTEKTMLHEFIHAALYEIGINHLTLDLEEQLAEGLSTAIHKCFFNKK